MLLRKHSKPELIKVQPISRKVLRIITRERNREICMMLNEGNNFYQHFKLFKWHKEYVKLYETLLRSPNLIHPPCFFNSGFFFRHKPPVDNPYVDNNVLKIKERFFSDS